MVISNKKKDQINVPVKFVSKELPLGIDIGTTSIKVVRLTLVDNKPKISKLIIKDLPSEVAGNKEQYSNAVSSALLQIVEENKFRGQSAFIAVSLDDCQIKNTSLSKIPRKDIDVALRTKMQQEGVNIGEISYDYIILDQDRIDQVDKINLLVVEAKKEAILERMSLLDSADLNISAVGVEPLSLLDCLNYNASLKDDEVVILIDFGGSLTQINIIVNKQLCFSRKLNINSSSLTNSISKYCKVSIQEADQLKIKYDPNIYIDFNILKSYVNDPNKPLKKGAVDIDHINVRDAIYFSLESLVSSIKQTFKYFSYELTNSKIQFFDRIILSCGSTDLKIISPYLKESLGVSVDAVKPLGTLEFLAGVHLNIYNLDRDSFRFGVAMGLVLSDLYDSPEKRLSLIPQKVERAGFFGIFKRLFLRNRISNQNYDSKDTINNVVKEVKKVDTKVGYSFGNWNPAREMESARALSEQLGISFIDLSSYKIDTSVVKLVPCDVAKKLQSLPIFKTGSSLIVAMANPLDVIAIDELTKISGFSIDPVFATASGIKDAISRYYGE